MSGKVVGDMFFRWEVDVAPVGVRSEVAASCLPSDFLNGNDNRRRRMDGVPVLIMY